MTTVMLQEDGAIGRIGRQCGFGGITPTCILGSSVYSNICIKNVKLEMPQTQKCATGRLAPQSQLTRWLQFTLDHFIVLVYSTNILLCVAHPATHLLTKFFNLSSSLTPVWLTKSVLIPSAYHNYIWSSQYVVVELSIFLSMLVLNTTIYRRQWSNLQLRSASVFNSLCKGLSNRVFS